DRDVPKDAINGRVDEAFVKRAVISLASGESFGDWKKRMVQRVREHSFRGFPERIAPAEPGRGVRLGWTHQELTTEGGIEANLISSNLKDQGDSRTGSLLVLSPGEHNGGDVPDWAKPLCADPAFAHWLEPRGVAGTVWTRKSPPNYPERAHALLGRTVDEGRVLDIAATVRYLASRWPGKPRWQLV